MIMWELWRRCRRDGQPDAMIDSGKAGSKTEAYAAIRVAEQKFPIGYVPELGYAIVADGEREEGGWTPNRWAEGGW